MLDQLELLDYRSRQLCSYDIIQWWCYEKTHYSTTLRDIVSTASSSLPCRIGGSSRYREVTPVPATVLGGYCYFTQLLIGGRDRHTCRKQLWFQVDTYYCHANYYNVKSIKVLQLSVKRSFDLSLALVEQEFFFMSAMNCYFILYLNDDQNLLLNRKTRR